MSQNTGTTLMMTSSPGQQIAGDLSRELFRGYQATSAKIRTQSNHQSRTTRIPAVKNNDQPKFQKYENSIKNPYPNAGIFQ